MQQKLQQTYICGSEQAGTGFKSQQDFECDLDSRPLKKAKTANSCSGAAETCNGNINRALLPCVALQ